MASARWRKIEVVPVEAKVAAILRPMCPDLPRPLTISLPRQPVISPTARLEAFAQAVRKRVERARLIVKHIAPETQHVRLALHVHHAARGAALPAAGSSCGSPAEITCAATRSPMTFSVVRHMSRKRSTPSTRAIACGSIPTIARISATTGSEPAGHARSADAAEDADEHDHHLLPEGQFDAEELREEDDRHALEHRRAILVGGGADGQHEARDPARKLRASLRRPAARSAGSRSTRRSRRPSGWPPGSRGRRRSGSSCRASSAAREDDEQLDRRAREGPRRHRPTGGSASPSRTRRQG